VMDKKFEIYFVDLTVKAQEALLKEFETTIKDENWDIFPITIIERIVDIEQPKETIIKETSSDLTLVQI
jgi:hypothetical protein